MGVFDRFFRRKEEVAAEEVVAEAVTTESGAADEAEAEPAVAEAPAAEAVEIPKQQSAEVAADSEAGEGART
ncbi:MULTISPECIES: gliding motility protein [unclassified Streptomyces]|uniref:gliding motility protein n=1 Tax=unclassified Streptomyces TaxID=2593676 RepID=UPI00214AE56D|nr:MULTISPECIES: gliding motility protein [unclassified Streptomyces]MCX5011326.1 gliding motility protein [Streptomyces sp. NBC_00555]MCX5611813.1 gliding motility protein [Streptomyces sp. NBC_00047]UUU39631.1 gliding motility protein [Streptomyces sp. NBC_00162]